MSHWLFLPLDGRPCNARFPVQLAALAGERLYVPDISLLGDARTAARRDRLQAWLESRLKGAQGLLLSLDTWIYGNLVASRKNREPLRTLQEKIQLLQNYRAQQPELKIHAFATLLRLSNSHDDTEERPYWAQYGKEIYRYAWLEHYLQMHTDHELESEYKALSAQIPADVLEDYRALRLRNFTLLENLLDTVEQGLLQTLLIGCDDGGRYGWTVMERAQLQAQIDSRGLSERVLLYPGADELACTLLARVLVPETPRISLRWTYPEASQQITRYEGLPLKLTLAHQARAAGVELVSESSKGDAEPEAVLWMHNPPAEQIDQYLDRDSRVYHQPEQLEPLLNQLKAAGPIALADVCYANGGDELLLKRLEAEQLLFNLSAYAAWNTAGNTIGMLLAWFKLLLLRPGNEAEKRLFLIERFADDGWYQGIQRQLLCGHYSEPVTLNSCIQAIAFFNDKFRDWQTWMPQAPSCLQIERLSFPWKRFFEVDLRACNKALD